MNKRQRVILLILITLVVVFAAIFSLTRKSEPINNGSGADGPIIVSIDNTQELESILLATQFGAVRQAIATYIQTNIGKNVSLASIVGQPQVKKDSNIVFSVKTSDPEKLFTVLLDRKAYDRIEFFVEGTNYHVTLYTYKSTNAP